MRLLWNVDRIEKYIYIVKGYVHVVKGYVYLSELFINLVFNELETRFEYAFIYEFYKNRTMIIIVV